MHKRLIRWSNMLHVQSLLSWFAVFYNKQQHSMNIHEVFCCLYAMIRILLLVCPSYKKTKENYISLQFQQNFNTTLKNSCAYKTIRWRYRKYLHYCGNRSRKWDQVEKCFGKLITLKSILMMYKALLVKNLLRVSKKWTNRKGNNTV